MHITTLVVTPFQQNCRLLIDPESKKLTVVDPGGEVDQIIAEIQASGAEVEQIFTTHAHIDHIGGVSTLEEELEKLGKPKPKLIGHRIEEQMRKSIERQAEMFGVAPGYFRNMREPDVYLEHGESLLVGKFEAKALFTPGHSPGHLSLYFENVISEATGGPTLIAGDALFNGSIGRTDLPGGDHQTLIESIKRELLVLPEDTEVLCGHGPNTTIGKEKTSNPFLQMEV